MGYGTPTTVPKLAAWLAEKHSEIHDVINDYEKTYREAHEKQIEGDAGLENANTPKVFSWYGAVEAEMLQASACLYKAMQLVAAVEYSEAYGPSPDEQAGTLP